MKLLDDYLRLKDEIHTFFGYVEDWRVIPLDDARDYWWMVDPQGSDVLFADNKESVLTRDGSYYSNEVLGQHKSVYRGDGYAMIVVDTYTDGNTFLKVFDNTKEVPWVADPG